MKKTFILTALIFSVNTLYSQTLKKVIINRYPKEVPAGKIWRLNISKKVKVEVSKLTLERGSKFNALFLSNPKFLYSIAVGENGQPSKLYTIIFKELEKIPFSNDYSYNIKPITFVDENFSLSDLTTENEISNLGVKEITFEPGEKVYVGNGLDVIELDEIPKNTTKAISAQSQSKDEMVYKSDYWINSKAYKSFGEAGDNPVVENVKVIHTKQNFKVFFGKKLSIYTIVGYKRFSEVRLDYTVKKDGKMYLISLCKMPNGNPSLLIEKQWAIPEAYLD
ncbi:hypothetical protein [Solitalea koreensis]|uniref:Uncharacterized protein n=1 Tax=Solitalea koreensis TaxID=543615 RepID=A0A521E8E9_9SPHI|nr:hypothetical protein [Solitalea koreensis]SMO79701.1 hypothetical protein SAMN06265350_1129 [Solitalea koreensis]